MTRNALKFFVVFIALLSLLSVGVAAADDISFVESSVSMSGDTGEQLSEQITIKNDGTTDGFITFSDYELTHSSNSAQKLALNSMGAIHLNSGENGSTTVTLNIPSNQYSGVYNGNLQATLGSDTETLPVSVNVNPNTPSISLGTPTNTVVAGTSEEAKVNLVNTGNVDINSVVLSVSDLTSGSNTLSSTKVTVSPSSTSLNYGETKEITLTVEPEADQPSGTYTGTLTAVYGSQQTTVTYTVVVQAQQPSMTVTSGSAVWAKGLDNTKEVEITVENTGNIDLSTVQMDADQIGGAAIVPSPSSFSLQKDKSQKVTLTITGVGSGQATGTFTGDITATSGDTEATGTLTLTVRDPVRSISVSSDTVQLGSSSVQRNSTQTATLTITNNGDYDIDSVDITSTAGSRYGVVLSANNFALSKGSVKTVTVTGTVPEDQDSGLQTIGTLSIAYGGTVPTKLDITMDAESKLKFSKVKAYVGSATDSNVNNGDTIEDEARLGDEVELEITVHNEFSSSSNIEIEDVKIDMVVQDLDDGSDLEKDTSEFKVRDDQKKKQSLHFTVPDNIEEGTYKINLKVVGQDENGARHSDEWNINLEVEKRNHDLLIREFRFSPNNGLACGETIKSLVTRIENRGSNFEEDVRITIEQDKLDVYIEQVFELDNDLDDEDSEYRKTHTVLVPSDAEAGVYPFTLWVYYDEDVPFDYSEQTLVVEDCADQATQPKDDDSGDDDGTVVITSPPTVQQPPEPEQQQELVDEPWFVAALAIVAVVILGMLLAVVKILVAPRR